MRAFVITLCLLSSASCFRSKQEIPAATPVATPLAVETVAVAKDENDKAQPGLWPNPFVSADGQLFIAHCEGFQGDVRLEKRTLTGWQSSEVDSKGPVGKYLRVAVGPSGPEMIYLDQSRSTLRHAIQTGGAWDIVDIDRDPNEIGISSQFVINPKGDRIYAHYNVRNQVLLTTAPASSRKFTSKVVATAGGVWQVSLGMRWSTSGSLLLSFANWNISSGSLVVARSDDLQTLVSSFVADAENVAGLKSQWLDDENLVYMSSRGGLLYGARVTNGQLSDRTLLTANVANFTAIKTADGRTVIALQSGLEDGLGEGVVELAVREANKPWKRTLVDGNRSVGLHMGLFAEPKTGVVHLAYHDETRRGLRYLRVER